MEGGGSKPSSRSKTAGLLWQAEAQQLQVCELSLLHALHCLLYESHASHCCPWPVLCVFLETSGPSPLPFRAACLVMKAHLPCSVCPLGGRRLLLPSPAGLSEALQSAKPPHHCLARRTCYWAVCAHCSVSPSHCPSLWILGLTLSDFLLYGRCPG